MSALFYLLLGLALVHAADRYEAAMLRGARLAGVGGALVAALTAFLLSLGMASLDARFAFRPIDTAAWCARR